MKSANQSKISAGRIRLFEAICDEFESECKSGRKPCIEDYLARVEEKNRPALLHDLSEIESYYRDQPEQSPIDRAPTPLRADTASTLSQNLATADFAGPVLYDGDGQSLPVVPGYEILEVLGRGGMGVVYKARHAALNRLVALKMILAGAHAGRHELARFRTEAQAVARLQHPNIVQIHEVGEADGLPFFSLEFVDGGSLDGKLASTPQPAKQAAETVEIIARAMHVAHERGIVHRDLKPANVLIAGDGTLKITDFGLAKQLDSDAPRTHTGAIMGTPSYMAPEQASGKVNEIGPATDVYALGSILYEMVTGRPPFKGVNAVETMQQVKANEPVPLRRLQPKTPRDLETICLKCLHKDAGKRYLSAADLADDLRRFLDWQPIHARPVGHGERLWRWCRRKPALAAASSAALLAVLIALATFAVAFFLVSQSRDEAIDLAKEKERQRLKAVKLANENGLLAINALKDKHNIDERRKQAETLVVQLKFEEAYRQPEDNRALSMLRSAGLLREANLLENQPLQDSLRLHLGSWVEQQHRLMRVFSHKGAVGAVAFSPDRKTVLMGDSDYSQLYETATGKPFGVPLAHPETVWATVFSPDSNMVLTGSGNTAQLWDAATGKPLASPLTHKKRVRVVAFSPDSKTVATADYSRDHSAQLWETATGNPLGAPLQHQGGITAIAFSPDGRSVLTASIDRTAHLWETATGKPLASPLTHKYPVNAVAFSPDGMTVLTGSNDKTAQLWEAATGKPLGPPLQHQGYVTTVAFNPDGKSVLTGCSDRIAQQWEAATGTPLGLPLQHKDSVLSMAFSPDGMTVLTGSADKTAQLWEAATGKPLGLPLQHQDHVSEVAFSPDGKTVLTGSGDTARVWQKASDAVFGPLFQHQERILAVAFSRDGKTILTGSADKTAQLWDSATGTLLGLEKAKISMTGICQSTQHAGE